MKILVLSDSHTHLEYMRQCIDRCKPDAVFHLGDYYQDALAVAQEYADVIFHCVPGNCDQYKPGPVPAEVRFVSVGGVRFMMTHGHRHGVKQGLTRLIAQAWAEKADCIIFGHTHQALIQQEGTMWVVNPGTCGYFGSSAAVIEVVDHKISDCRILRQSDLEGYV